MKIESCSEKDLEFYVPQLVVVNLAPLLKVATWILYFGYRTRGSLLTRFFIRERGNLWHLPLSPMHNNISSVVLIKNQTTASIMKKTPILSRGPTLTFQPLTYTQSNLIELFCTKSLVFDLSSFFFEACHSNLKLIDDKMYLFKCTHPDIVILF